MGKIKLKDLNTYVYIDSSNISNALKVCNIELDFFKLYVYLKKTYPKLKSIKYFEGLDREDYRKQKTFEKLQQLGYEIKTLQRKTYPYPAKYRIFRCSNCNTKNNIRILRKKKVLKSNIDVYLCSELMSDLLNLRAYTHAIIFTCDGDFADMIAKILNRNKKLHISVFATPFRQKNNYLSIRLKELENISRYYLVNILNIKDYIKKK
jgi:uncharacterized LabA/DUF88 family protein